MRCPLYFGVAVGLRIGDLLPDAVTVRSSTAGGYELAKGDYEALAILLGRATLGGTTYRVCSLLVTKGDQRKAYRWLRSKPAIQGPYHLGDMPNALRRWLFDLVDGGLDDQGNPVTYRRLNPVLSGERWGLVERYRYVRGADPSGDADLIVEVSE